MWPLRRKIRNLGIGPNPASPNNARRELARALLRQEKRLRGVEAGAIDVQLVGQISCAEDWPRILAYWDQLAPTETARWTRSVEPGVNSLNLWPVPAGRIGWLAGKGGDVGKRQPKTLLSTSSVIHLNPDKNPVDAETALAIICTHWLEGIGMKEYEALRLAPPVLETWARRGRLISREIIDFGLAWPLPPTEGI
jgi:hypothetical protein